MFGGPYGPPVCAGQPSSSAAMSGRASHSERTPGGRSPARLRTAERAAARLLADSAVLTLAGDLPPGVRAEWLARPDVAALLEG